MTLQALYQAFQRRCALDTLLRSLRKRIDNGSADFSDTAAYSERIANLLGNILSRHIESIPVSEREQVCKWLLQAQYKDINSICEVVQTALDEAQGIHLAPQKAPFPAERVQQVAHSLLDPTVKPETIQRRANQPVATVAKSFHDDYIKTNAQVRNDLGFKCYLDRVAATGCCAWCTRIAGRYVYGEHPDDIFRRHDNCSCTVTFENGRQRQDVWSKRTWDADPAEVEANEFKPVVLAEEQADQINLLGKLKSLFSGQPYQECVTELAKQLSGIQNQNVAKLLRNALDNTSFAQSPDRRSFYHGGKVYLSKSATPSTIAHELFHRIDTKNKITESGLLHDCLITDYERLKNISENAGQTLEDVLYLKYKDTFSKPGKMKPDFRGISDIIEGMTNGATRLGYGHIASKPDYWQKPGTLSRETFAQYGRMYFEEKPAVLGMLKELFPDTTAQIDAIIPAIAQFER